MTNTVYNKHYKNENYFGKPYKQLIEFFTDFTPKGTILDLGCGQGRDSIVLAKLGYEIIAVDYSSLAINQLKQKSDELNIKAEIADIYSYPITTNIDIVLLDSILHFYKNDINKESALVSRILRELKPQGIFCNCMINGKKREELLHNLIKKSKHNITILLEQDVDYPEFKAQFHMLVVKKN
ncbi:class I SAM-dependent methyltransferase [Clostridium sp. 'deep sea']|uniref:class I SAM-dependent methyltransferase n=1 Tax=Clostridium sp. 'deep sea' TaxID=2779445 RepID=UPI001A9BD55B|nr:class I SAM-dependent methyltransferase [Clostridium sp. 'deep sea']